MKTYNFIHYEEIPSLQTVVKFKEFYFDKNDPMDWKPVKDNSYYRINLDLVSMIILNDDNDLVTINGMVGKFFL